MAIVRLFRSISCPIAVDATTFSILIVFLASSALLKIAPHHFPLLLYRVYILYKVTVVSVISRSIIFRSLIISAIDATVKLAVIVALAKYYNAEMFTGREMGGPGIYGLIGYRARDTLQPQLFRPV